MQRFAVSHLMSTRGGSENFSSLVRRGIAHILPAVWDGAAKLDVPLFIVEKQTAALLLGQNGFAGIALNGTWGASHPKAELEDGAKRVLHHDLRRFSLVGREVYLCFDTDFQVRESVLEGLIRTFILFVLSEARVKVLQWPSEHKGLDDFISHTAQLNLEEQKKAIHTLVEPVHSLNVKERRPRGSLLNTARCSTARAE